jgi:dCMP deaminase
MEHAKLVATRGTCPRLQVGALVHREGRILVTGYNGAPSGLPHCDHGEDAEPCTWASHAERNCIDWAARLGISLLGAELVTTDTPCWQCAGSVINAGIRSVVSLRDYRLRQGVEMLTAAGVACSLYADVIA